MVVLTFSVTDKKGNHVNGLKPEDIRIFEDGAEQKIVFVCGRQQTCW